MSKPMALGGNRDTKKALASLERIAPARLQLNIHPDLHDQFKNLSFNNKDVMSDLITEFVINYVRENGIKISEQTKAMYLGKPKDWTR